MIDTFHNQPTGPRLDLFDGDEGAFAVVTVRPRPDGDFKPVMPLLSRGQSFTDDLGDAWTVLRATVLGEEDRSSGDELPYRYAYEYVVVNGKRNLT